MTKAWLKGFWQLGVVTLITGSAIALSEECIFAQLQPDRSLGSESTIVNSVAENIDLIRGGTIRGTNLLHSFLEFNVGEGKAVYFANPQGIENIFSRVTGNNSSQIQGVLGVLGKANLYLLNPNGIIFSERAKLDINGSFVATTAESILFQDGQEFSATNPQKPILEIKVPLGLQIGSNPGVIVNQSVFGLQVQPGKNLSLIGGDVGLTGGVIFAPGGRVELGGLSTSGIIDINRDGSLIFPENAEKGDVFLNQGAGIIVLAGGGGAIAINSKNLELTEGSSLFAGIAPGSGAPEAQAGDIIINAADRVTLDTASSIYNLIFNQSIGNGGKIEINSGNLRLSNDSSIGNSTYGQGNAGRIKIKTQEEIILDKAFIDSTVSRNAQGKSGDISINTKLISLLNNAFIETSSLGKGDAGNIQIYATEKFTLNYSSVNSSILKGSISVDSTIINLLGEGNAGKIEINSPEISLANNSEILTNNQGKGNAGNIFLEASDLFFAANNSTVGSNIGQLNGTPAEGKVGTIAIAAKKVSLTDSSRLSAAFGSNTKGEPGSISIKATDSISFDGFESGIFTIVSLGAIANGSNIKLEANSISIANGARISASNFGEGNGGSIEMTAQNTISVDSSSIDSGLSSTARGSSGKIDIKAVNLFLNNGAQLTTESLGLGNAGNIEVSADLFTLDRGSSILALNTPLTDISNNLSSGNVTLQISDRLILRNNSDISTQASNNANGGNIEITANAVIAFDDSDIFAFAEAGKGGNITLNTPAYFGNRFTANSLNANPDILDNNDRADINATGAVSGVVTIPDVSFLQNSLTALPENVIDTNALVANSCIARSSDRTGTFTITGAGSLPNRPGNAAVSSYPTGDVRGVESDSTATRRPWKLGDPIIEPQAAYRLANGQLVLSRECER